ncbi:MAG TPA: hypothetical protein VLT62_06780 [Candidatus Methylomirabilis sp.]|nr:hypothetical protein [Candidatus Methylomirabilis sp.]
MPALTNPHSLISQSALYRIRVAGRLGPEWAERLGGLTLASRTAQDWGTITELCGHLPDQAALMGVLAQLYGTGAPLLSVEWLPASEGHGAKGAGGAVTGSDDAGPRNPTA